MQIFANVSFYFSNDNNSTVNEHKYISEHPSSWKFILFLHAV